MRILYLLIILIVLWNNLYGQNIKDYVLANTHSINSIDPSDINFTDLEPLKKAIGEARVVMLGEQDHGDAPCFLAKTRMIKYLHQELGFEVLAFESDFFGLNRTWEQLDKLGIQEIYSNIYPLWTRCIQNKDLFTYLNDQIDIDNPLIISGFDSRHALKYSKNNYINEFDSIIKITDIPFYTTSYHSFKPILIDIINEEHKSKIEMEQQQYFFQCLDTIQNQLKIKEFRDKEFWLQELKSLRAHAAYAWVFPKDDIRDKQMGNNLLWLIQQKYPDKKIIVWAHNFHIARLHNPIKNKKSKKPYYITMGKKIHEKMRDSIYSIAFSSFEGTAGRITIDKAYKVEKPKKNSFEKWIKTMGYKYAFVDLKNHKNKEEYFKMKGLDHNTYNSNWSNIFDGIFYIQDMYACEKKETILNNK